MSISAMKQALEALDCIYSPLHVREINKVGEAMSALRQAIAEAEKREWVGLTDDDYEELLETKDWGGSLIAATEAKLKEKNT